MAESGERIALVTGAAQGIGLGIANALATFAPLTILVDLQRDKATEAAENLRRSGRKTAVEAADVSDADSVDELVERVKRDHGDVLILANNAGVVNLKDGNKPSILDTTPEEWDHVVDVNMKGVFLMSRAFLPGMMKARWGRIINTASAAGRTYIAHSPAAYTAAKAGVVAMTWTLAAEAGPYGITVNSVAPGRIQTPLGATIKRPDDSFDIIPLRRPGNPEDVARVVKFLASDEGEYVTGATIDVGGGLYMA